MSRDGVLAILRREEGKFISGQEISEKLGISRAAVSKTVAALRREGYEIRSRTNRGYQLSGGPDVLSVGELAPRLTGEHIGGTVICLKEVDSTNRYLKQRALEGAASGTVAAAEKQSAGRGRLGREYECAPGLGCWFSVLLRPECDPRDVVNITAAAAVAVCQGIEDVCGVSPEIKWTNDLLLGGKKICGILTEMAVEGETGALQYLVMGIGINANHAPEDFSPGLGEIAGSIAMVTGKKVDRAALIGGVLNRLDGMYRRWMAGERDLEEYRARCITVGREIRVLRGGTERLGTALAVEDDFALTVRWEDGSVENLRSGEVSVRGLYGYR